MGIIKILNNFISFTGFKLVKRSHSNKEVAAQHNSVEAMDAFFSSKENLKSYLNPKRLTFYKNIVQFFESKGVNYNSKIVADAGCGTGHLLKYISDNYKPTSLSGFDYSPVTLKIAQDLLPNSKFATLDLHEGCDQQFEIIYCTEVLEHLMYPDIGLKNLARMVKPGGQLLLTVPNGRIDTYEGHINFWSPTSWQIFLKSNLENMQIESGIFDPEEAILLYAIIKN